MTEEEGISLLFKLVVVLVIVVTLVILATSLDVSATSRGSDFSNECAIWTGAEYKCSEDYYNNNEKLRILCEEEYPGGNSFETCQRICQNSCIAVGIGGE